MPASGRKPAAPCPRFAWKNAFLLRGVWRRNFCRSNRSRRRISLCNSGRTAQAYLCHAQQRCRSLGSTAALPSARCRSRCKTCISSIYSFPLCLSWAGKQRLEIFPKLKQAVVIFMIPLFTSANNLDLIMLFCPNGISSALRAEKLPIPVRRLPFEAACRASISLLHRHWPVQGFEIVRIAHKKSAGLTRALAPAISAELIVLVMECFTAFRAMPGIRLPSSASSVLIHIRIRIGSRWHSLAAPTAKQIPFLQLTTAADTEFPISHGEHNPFLSGFR